jgi:hypothetical protein
MNRTFPALRFRLDIINSCQSYVSFREVPVQKQVSNCMKRIVEWTTSQLMSFLSARGPIRSYDLNLAYSHSKVIGVCQFSNCDYKLSRWRICSIVSRRGNISLQGCGSARAHLELACAWEVEKHVLSTQPTPPRAITNSIRSLTYLRRYRDTT